MLLSNITASTAQRTNRAYVPSANASPYDCGNFSNEYSNANAYAMDMTVPTSAPQAFTPYASAASIQRFHSHPAIHVPMPHHATAAPAPLSTTPHQPALHLPRQFELPPMTAPQSRMQNLSPVQLTAGPVVPVYAPSTVSPYQLFVDVATGATLSIDDDDALMRQSGYAMPAVTVGHRMGYDAGEVIGHHAHHSHNTHTHYQQDMPTSMPAPHPADIYVPTPALHMPMVQEEVADLYASRTSMSRSPMMSPLVPPAPRTAAPVPTPAPAPSAASTPASPLAAASTYSVEVSGHHGRMQTVVSHVTLEEGTHVVFEGDRGLDMGIVVSTHISQSKAPTGGAIPMVVRSATEDEIQEWTVDLPAQAAEAAQECAAVVQSMRLKMAIRGASYQLDKQKLTFFYETAEHRVDFRKLLIELFNRYRCRIWMEKYNGAASESSSVSRQRR